MDSIKQQITLLKEAKANVIVLDKEDDLNYLY
jgi:hypothetical protein